MPHFDILCTFGTRRFDSIIVLEKLKPAGLIGLSLIVLYLLGILFIYVFINTIIFQPVRIQQEARYQTNQSYEEIIVTHPNQETIYGAYFKTKKVKTGCLLFFHGMQQNIDNYVDRVDDFLRIGLDVVMIDYRGFGKSKGKISELGMNEDALLIMQWLSSKISTDSIYVYACGLGASPASYITNLHPVRMLILENPISSLREWMRYQYPALVLPYELKYDFNIYESLSANIVPLAILQSTKDSNYPKDLSEKFKAYIKDEGNFIRMECSSEKEIVHNESYQLFLKSLESAL